MVKSKEDLDKLVDAVMDELDKPENGAWLRSAVGRIRSIRIWHDQIDELAKQLGTEITGDPDHLAKLDRIGKMIEKYDIYS